MTLHHILQALYSMALESALVCTSCEQHTYTYDFAIASDGTLISVLVAASKFTTGEIVLTCDNEQFRTNDFTLAAYALYNAITL